MDIIHRVFKAICMLMCVNGSWVGAMFDLVLVRIERPSKSRVWRESIEGEHNCDMH